MGYWLGLVSSGSNEAKGWFRAVVVLHVSFVKTAEQRCEF